MHDDLSLKEIQKEWHGTALSYLIGFIFSLLLTFASFILVVTKAISGPYLIYALIGLALVQAIIQVLFFLHVGQEAKPRWETLVFYFMILVLIIIALGSLWVMYDLNNRVMAHMTMETPHD